MGLKTTHSTLYAAKSTVNDVGDNLHCDGANLNNIRLALQEIEHNMPRKQNVVLDSAGTTIITPVWKQVPTAVFLQGHTSSAHDMLATSCIATALASSTITVVHGTGSDQSALAVIFYL